jgi:hypothetical protein
MGSAHSFIEMVYASQFFNAIICQDGFSNRPPNPHQITYWCTKQEQEKTGRKVFNGTLFNWCLLCEDLCLNIKPHCSLGVADLLFGFADFAHASSDGLFCGTLTLLGVSLIAFADGEFFCGIHPSWTRISSVFGGMSLKIWAIHKLSIACITENAVHSVQSVP